MSVGPGSSAARTADRPASAAARSATAGSRARCTAKSYWIDDHTTRRWMCECTRRSTAAFLGVEIQENSATCGVREPRRLEQSPPAGGRNARPTTRSRRSGCGANTLRAPAPRPSACACSTAPAAAARDDRAMSRSSSMSELSCFSYSRDARPLAGRFPAGQFLRARLAEAAVGHCQNPHANGALYSLSRGPRP